MTDLAEATLRARRITCMDITYNTILTGVGVGLVAFSIAMLVLTASAYGASLKMMPLYAFLSCAGLSGCVLSFLAFKRMVDMCRRTEQFDEETHR